MADLTRTEEGWVAMKRDGMFSRGTGGLAGRALACHGKHSGFESRLPQKSEMGDFSKGVVTHSSPHRKILKTKLFLSEKSRTLHRLVCLFTKAWPKFKLFFFALKGVGTTLFLGISISGK